jgi:hypothetical protein
MSSSIMHSRRQSSHPWSFSRSDAIDVDAGDDDEVAAWVVLMRGFEAVDFVDEGISIDDDASCLVFNCDNCCEEDDDDVDDVTFNCDLSDVVVVAVVGFDDGLVIDDDDLDNDADEEVQLIFFVWFVRERDGRRGEYSMWSSKSSSSSWLFVMVGFIEVDYIEVEVDE